MDDSVKVVNPKFVIKVILSGNLISEYGAYVIIRDDLLQAVQRCLHEHQADKSNCLIEIYEHADKILSLRLKGDADKLEAL